MFSWTFGQVVRLQLPTVQLLPCRSTVLIGLSSLPVKGWLGSVAGPGGMRDSLVAVPTVNIPDMCAISTSNKLVETPLMWRSTGQHTRADAS